MHLQEIVIKEHYRLEYGDGTVKKVSKKTFKKRMYSDVTYCAVKVKSRKLVKAILTFDQPALHELSGIVNII